MKRLDFFIIDKLRSSEIVQYWDAKNMKTKMSLLLKIMVILGHFEESFLKIDVIL